MLMYCKDYIVQSNSKNISKIETCYMFIFRTHGHFLNEEVIRKAARDLDTFTTTYAIIQFLHFYL